MIFSTITQNKLTVTADTTEIPAQYSNNIQFEFVQDTENYSGYTPTVYVTLYDSSLIECADILNAGGNVAIENGIFTIGNQILYQSGYLAVGITLTNGDENVALPPIIYKVLASVGGLSPLPPDDGEWQQVVDAYVNTLFETWSTENLTPIQNQLQSLVSEAQQLQQTAANQQTQIDDAISVMGDYQIVSEDPVQIQFKKGNGDFGPTVDLGDGLASKSMVNGKYYQSAAEMYSGAASNYGIQIQQIVGAYVQDGTPTPDNPVEPQFNVINNFNTNGGNLFDINGNVNIQGNNGSQVNRNTVADGILTANTNTSSAYSCGQKIEGLKGKTISFSSKCLSTGNGTKAVMTIYDNMNVSYTMQVETNNIGKIENYTCQSDNVVVAFATAKGTGAQFTDIMVNFGDTAQPYTPYVGSSTTVSLELRALPDGTADVWEDGVKTPNVGVYEVTEINSIYTSSSGLKSFVVNISNKKQVSNNLFLCDKIQIINTGTATENSIYQNNNNFVILGTADDTLETFQQKFIGTKIYYALATPTTEPLAIPTLTSYYPFTNAWCDSQVPGMITWNVLTGNVKIDQLDPAIEDYVNGNVPDLISNYISQNVPDMITNAINSALASYCPFAVGDIYITSLSANPNTKYPGTTWQAISGETLVGYLEGDENFGTLGASVGEATHTLTIDEMPSHNHAINGSLNTSSSVVVQAAGGSTSTTVETFNSNNTGGGQAHNNIQPSRVVMIWQRTA